MDNDLPIPETFGYYLVDAAGDVVAFHRSDRVLQPDDVVTVAAGPGAGDWRVFSVLGCQATVAPRAAARPMDETSGRR